MSKYIKWIFLLTGTIIITITLSLNFINNNSKSKELIKQNSKINDIYNDAWFKTKFEMYINNELKYETNINEPQYIIFKKENIQIIDQKTNEINTYKYTYKNKIINIINPPLYLPEGTYSLTLEKEQLKLTSKDNETTKIYTFTKAAG